MLAPLISDDGKGSADPRGAPDNCVPALPGNSSLSREYGDYRSKEEICADAW